MPKIQTQGATRRKPYTQPKCPHDKRKAQCRECGGSSFCEHGKQKTHCRECGGSSFCLHGKWKATCRECGGSALCEHDKRKAECHVCSPHKMCTTCEFTIVAKSAWHHPLCAGCYSHANPDDPRARNYMVKEQFLRDALTAQFPDVDMVFNKTVGGGCSRRRPDVRIECFTHSIIIECDEHQHQGYSCETLRSMLLYRDLGHRPLVILRINPDAYSDEHGKHDGCFDTTGANGKLVLSDEQEWCTRVDALAERMRWHMEHAPEREFSMEQLFYNETE